MLDVLRLRDGRLQSTALAHVVADVLPSSPCFSCWGLLRLACAGVMTPAALSHPRHSSRPCGIPALCAHTPAYLSISTHQHTHY